MFGLGFSEVVILAVLGLILLGPEQLPDMARTLGRFINDLKRSTGDLTEEFKKQGFSDMDPQKFLDDIRPKFEDPHASAGQSSPATQETSPELPANNQQAPTPNEELTPDGKKPKSD